MSGQKDGQNGKGSNHPNAPSLFLSGSGGKHPNPRSRSITGPLLREAFKRHRGKPPKLETLPTWVWEEMLIRCRMGNFDFTAAGVLGITPRTFRAWKSRGRRAYEHWEDTGEIDENDEVYAAFFLFLLKATFHALSTKEIELYQEDPKFWMTKGPPREIWGGHEPPAGSPPINIYNQQGISIDGNGQQFDDQGQPLEEFESTRPTPEMEAGGINALLAMGYNLEKQEDGTLQLVPPSLPESAGGDGHDDRGDVAKMLTLDTKSKEPKRG